MKAPTLCTLGYVLPALITSVTAQTCGPLQLTSTQGVVYALTNGSQVSRGQALDGSDGSANVAEYRISSNGTLTQSGNNCGFAREIPLR